MANTFITPSVIAPRALATLYNNLTLAALVYRDYDEAFDGKVGDVVAVKIPATFTAQEFTSAITVQNATETSLNITLDTHLDVSFAVTAKDLTLELADFDEQLLMPAMEAIAQDIDGRLAEALVDQASTAGNHTSSPITGAYLADGTTNPNAAFRDARRILTRNKHGMSQRYAVLSPEAVADALSDDLIVTANQSGSTDALREGNIGRLFGFDTFESQVLGLGSGDKGQADGVAFHRDAVALTSRTLALPMGVGAGQAAVANYKGLGLRVVKDYDIDAKQDVVSVDTLIGVDNLRSDAAVELDFGQGS